MTNLNTHNLTPIRARLLHLMYSLRASRLPDRADAGIERFISGNLVAAPIPKVASRSLRSAMREVSLGAMADKHIRPEDVRGQFPDAFLLSFVRKSWARIHSCWKDKVDNALSRGKLRILSRFQGLHPFMLFEEFVEWIDTEAGSDTHADRHWLSQHRHLAFDAPHTFCDFIGKIERIDEGIERILRHTGTDFPRLPEAELEGSLGVSECLFRSHQKNHREPVCRGYRNVRMQVS